MKNAFYLFACALGILAVFLPSYQKIQELQEKNSRYEQEIIDLKKRNQSLAVERKLLTDDDVYLEKVGREKMGLVKEGEVILQMVPVNREVKK